MNEKPKNFLIYSAKKITNIFSTNEKKTDSKEGMFYKEQKYIHLNFLFLSAFLAPSKGKDKSKNAKPRRFSSSSSDKHFMSIVEQAYACCSKADLHLFPFKQFFLKNEFAMKRIIEWKLSKYIQEKKKLNELIDRMKYPPDIFRHHLITLLKHNEVVPEESVEELMEMDRNQQEDRWRLWQHHASTGPINISPPQN